MMLPEWDCGRLVLPPLDEGERAILQIHGKVSSWRTEPSLALSGSDGFCIYGLAPGEVGWFRFCLPPLTPGRESRLEIRTRGFVIDRGGCAVFCSREAPRQDERILILAPHPDDAEIAAYGFYKALAGRTWVLTMTGGQKGSRPADGEGLNERTRRAEIRVAESLELPVNGGVSSQRVGNLLLPDGGMETLLHGGQVRDWIDPGLPGVLKTRFPDAILPEVLCGSAEEATALLVSCLEKIRPDIVVSPHWLDTHADHRATATLLARAAQRASCRPRAIYAYTVHPVYSELEPFGAEGTASSPPVLLEDATLDAFHIHYLDQAAREAKKAVLSGISDLRVTEPQPSWWRDAWARLAGSRHPESYLRRAVRQHEWFEVFAPQHFYQGASCVEKAR
jgi:LmbE family N-acetylglucosaminyl deacetylase